MTTPRKPHVRRQYWNEPTMGWWERSYLLEVTRGLAITGGVFLRNMGKWVTGRKGALTTYYPEETRWDYAPANRCLLYTSDAADDLLCVDLGGRRITQKKKTPTPHRMHTKHQHRPARRARPS